MGTDIYLSYDGQEEEEQNAQASCLFESTKGEIGYLRAAIWMRAENDFLRRLFPDDIWESPEPRAFDFDENYEKFKFLAEHYLLGTDMNVPEDENIEMFKQAIQKLVKETGGKLHENPEMDSEARTKWLGSVKAFFEKGHDLQRAGRNPKVEISW